MPLKHTKRSDYIATWHKKVGDRKICVTRRIEQNQPDREQCTLTKKEFQGNADMGTNEQT